MSDGTEDRGRALLQLAATLRLAAQRLADSAGRMQLASHRQRDQVERLAALRDRIVDLLAACRRLTEPPPLRAAQSRDTRGPAAGKNTTQTRRRPLPPRPRCNANPPHAVPPPRSDANPPHAVPPSAPAHRLPPGAFIELSSWQEFDKFRHMAPITDQEVAACDVDELLRRLTEE